MTFSHGQGRRDRVRPGGARRVIRVPVCRFSATRALPLPLIPPAGNCDCARPSPRKPVSLKRGSTGCCEGKGRQEQRAGGGRPART